MISIKISKNGGSTKNGGGVGGKEEKDDGGEMGLFKQYALSCDMMAMIERWIVSVLECFGVYIYSNSFCSIYCGQLNNDDQFGVFVNVSHRFSKKK